MTQWVQYEQFTWPEIKALPRDLPLILPLGNAGNKEVWARDLGLPAHACLLPPLPFGWKGSGLEISGEVVVQLLCNLLDCLHEDGFQHVFLGVGNQLVPRQEFQVAFVTAENIPLITLDENAKDKVVLIPIGQTEQHGYHLPLSVDTLIISAICQSLVDQIPDLVMTIPPFPYGVSSHRHSFAGTLNCGARAFEEFWLGIVDCLANLGFKKIYLVTGHGGNVSYLTNVIKAAGERYPDSFLATAWLYLSGPQGLTALEKNRRSRLGGMGHACELETALMLHLFPNLVHMDRVIDETDFINTPSYYMDWIEGGALIANPPWEDDTRTGAYGAGSLATMENGRIWFQAAVAEKIIHIKEIHEQHHRRTEKRRNHLLIDQGYNKIIH